MFLTGFIAGVEVMRSLDVLARGGKPEPLVSVGRTAEGEEERVPHASLEDAEHLISLCAYPNACVVSDENRLFRVMFYVPGTARVAATAEIKRELRGTVAIVGTAQVMPSDEDWAATAEEVRELVDGISSAINPRPAVRGERAYARASSEYGFTLVEDTRARDMFSATPRYHTGVEAGVLVCEAFLAYLDGTVPPLYPSGALARDKGATRYATVQWREGDDVRAWYRDPVRKDAVVFWHVEQGAARTLTLIVPTCDGSDDLAFSVAWRAEVRDGVLLTSHLRAEIVKTTRAQYDAFVQGFEQGLKFHVRTRELDAGWGALGDYVPLG